MFSTHKYLEHLADVKIRTVMHNECVPFMSVNGVVKWLALPTSGPSCSKLTMSLVNNSLKFTLSDTQIC